MTEPAAESAPASATEPPKRPRFKLVALVIAGALLAGAAGAGLVVLLTGDDEAKTESSEAASIQPGSIDDWMAELAPTGLVPPRPQALWDFYKTTMCAKDDFGLFVTLSRAPGDMTLNQDRIGIKNACPAKLPAWDKAIVDLGATTDRVDYLCEAPLESLSLEESDGGISDRENAMIVCDQYQGPEWESYYDEYFAP